MYRMVNIGKFRQFRLWRSIVNLISIFILLTPFQPLYADQREETINLRKLIATFFQNPKTAEDAIDSLGNWKGLSQLSGVSDYAKRKVPGDSESALLTALDRVRSQIPQTSLEKLFNYSRGRAGRSNLSVEERDIALKTANHAMGEILSRSLAPQGIAQPPGSRTKLLSQDLTTKLSRHGVFLKRLAMDKNEEDAVRRTAIKGIRSLDIQDAVSDLKILAENRFSQESVPVQKEALIALSHMRASGVEKIATKLLETTPDKDVFGAAAYGLGQLQTKSALSSLAANAGRLPGESLSIRAAVNQYSDWVNDTIEHGKGEDLLFALQILPHIQWREPDLFREKLKSLLAKLDPDIDTQIIGEILKRLVAAKLQQPDCNEILEMLNNRIIDASALFPNEYSYFDQCARRQEVQEQGKETRK